MATFIRFERGRDGLIGPTFGPFDFVQITYDLLRVGPDGYELAYLNHDRDWEILGFVKLPEGHTERWYSDVIVWSE